MNPLGDRLLLALLDGTVTAALIALVWLVAELLLLLGGCRYTVAELLHLPVRELARMAWNARPRLGHPRNAERRDRPPGR